jgi:hypothetical protein
VGREHAAYKRVGSRVERRQTLDKGGYGKIALRRWYMIVHLEQIKHDVWRPAQHEYCNSIKQNMSV